MADQVDSIVIGAGVVGLAIARALAIAGKSPLIIEGEAHFGTWTSSRNSEVIHAGLYYPEGSLKARLCVDGKSSLYSFCEARKVPFKRLGKIIFAHDQSQIGDLELIMARAAAAGVDDLTLLDQRDARNIEPSLDCVAALYSPSTGIIDSHAYMFALLAEAEEHGAVLAKNSKIDRISYDGGIWRVFLVGEDDATVGAPILINSAGLAAQKVASSIDALPETFVPLLYFARGVYFTYSGRTPFSHLIYPAPEPGGLGTHLTLDLAGQARFGPDVEWIDAIEYTVDPNRHEKFVAAARRIWPALDPSRLQPGYAGIRPKLSRPGDPAADFMISGPAEHGCEGLVNLFGIESPGLTASLAIADQVVQCLN